MSFDSYDYDAWPIIVGRLKPRREHPTVTKPVETPQEARARRMIEQAFAAEGAG